MAFSLHMPQNRANDNTLLFDSYLIYELELMEKTAALLGLDDDARSYADWREQRRKYVNTNYIDTLTARTIGAVSADERKSTWTGYVGCVERGRDIDTHTSYAVPLALGVPYEAAAVVLLIIWRVSSTRRHVAATAGH